MIKQIKVRVIPRAKKTEIVGALADGALKIKLKAPPVDGKANEALIEFLSEEWNIAKSKMRVIRGKTSRTKIIEITNSK